jgi:predicted enzyme related to lactoylglutathione lyase
VPQFSERKKYYPLFNQFKINDMENRPGKIMWHDLTVEDAEKVSEFYKAVVGWEKEGLSMGNYEDYVMKTSDGEGVAGVCHAKGANQYIPSQWLIYVGVENLDKSLDNCKKMGGKILGDKRKMGKDVYCLIQDPAGAYMMIYEKG